VTRRTIRSPAALGFGDGLFAVSGLGDDLEIRLRLEDLPQSDANECLVVGDE
jgi:hypothetical protein